MSNENPPLSDKALEVARRIGSLRDFLEFLKENGQCINWSEEVYPETDIRNVAVAAGRDSMNGPAVIFDNIAGYPGKKMVLGVHGSFTNIALLLGHPKGTTIKELFYDIISRWDADEPLLNFIEPDKAPVNENRLTSNFNLYDLLPLYRINEYDGGFYIGKANVVSRDPRDPDNFGKQNVGIYRIQVQAPGEFTLLSVPAHDMGRHIMAAEQEGVPLKISVLLGNHPAMCMFAATHIGYDESEFAYASQMMGSPMRLTKSGNGMDILADSEMVIEAELMNGVRSFEGPFGEFPGSYSGVRKTPRFKVKTPFHTVTTLSSKIFILVEAGPNTTP